MAGVTQFNSNVAIGVSPGTWVANRRVLEIGGLAASALALNGTAAVGEVFANVTRDTAGTYRYAVNGPAGYFDFNNSAAGWSWSIAAAGTAGNSLVFSPSMTLTATGLGIGGSPSYKLDVVGDSRVIGDTYVFKNQAGAVESKRLIFGSAANSSAAAISSLTATANDGYLSLFTKKAGTLTEQVWIDNNGNTTVSYGNLVMGTAGKGIDFSSGSNAAGMTSELLNDYEEGTWTGTLKGSVSDPTTPVAVSGRYTKIGRMVQISVNFAAVNTTGASGNVSISGLPFNSASDGVGSNGAAGLYLAGTFTGYVSATVLPNSSIIDFYWYQSNGVNGNVTHNAGSGRYVNATVVYYV